MTEEREGGGAVAEGEKKKAPATGSTVTTAKMRKGIVSRIWNGLFRLHGDDFDKRLQYISKEEANVLKRMNKRTMIGRKRLRQLIYFSVLLETIAVVTTTSVDVDWRMRAIRVCLWERKDQKLLEKLRA